MFNSLTDVVSDESMHFICTQLRPFFFSFFFLFSSDGKYVAAHLEELEQLLKGIAMMKELTLRTKDYLVSFGECMSTRLFAAYLNKIGMKARQVCLNSSLLH